MPAVRTGTEPPAPRLPVIDAARAVALLAMAGYHALWDLGHLRLTPENVALTPAGRHAAEGIAATFLILVGVGLVLMNGRGIRPRSTLVRLARVGGAAGLVTLGTYAVFPDAYVFFGVLHCIAVASVLGLPFLSAPLPAVALGAVAVLAAPSLLVRGAWHAPWLDAPALAFLGLGSVTPATNDFVPLFPWFGLVLAGVLVGRVGLPALRRSQLAGWSPRTRLARAATFAGRHSLMVYLVHQPVLLGLLSGLALAAGPHPRAGLKEFRATYVGNCTRTGGEPAPCRIAARCTSEALVREGLFRDDGRPFTVPERARAQALSRGCYAAAEGAPIR